MNPYAMLGSGNGAAAALLSARLAAWHDAMVAHERRLRAGRGIDVCGEECPHGDARMLWVEAVEAFGTRAHELTFLRSHSIAASGSSEEVIAPGDLVSEAADSSPRSIRLANTPAAWRSKPLAGAPERSLTATAAL